MKIKRIFKISTALVVAIAVAAICSLTTFMLGTYMGSSFRRVRYEELAANAQNAHLQAPSAEEPTMRLPKAYDEFISNENIWQRSDVVAMGKADISFERFTGDYKSDHVFSAKEMLIDRTTFLAKYLAQLAATRDDAKSLQNGISGEEGWELYFDGTVSVFIVQYQQYDHDVVETHILGPSGLWRRAVLGWEPNLSYDGDGG